MKKSGISYPFTTVRHNAANDAHSDYEELDLLLNWQQQLLEHLSQGLGLQELLDTLCLGAERMLRGDIVLITLLDEPTNKLNIISAPKLSKPEQALFNRLEPGPRSRSCGAAVFLGKPVYSTDTLTDKRWSKSQDIVELLKIRASWSHPIFDTSHKAIGSASIACSSPRTPSSFEKKVLETAARIASIAITHHRSSTELHASASSLDHIAASLPGAVLQTEFTNEMRPYFSYVSAGLQEICGISPKEAMKSFGKVWYKLNTRDRSRLESYIQSASPQANNWTTECQIQDAEGQDKWVYITSTPEWDEQTGLLQRVNSIALDVTQEKEAKAQLELAGIAFSATNEGIMVSDRDSIILDVNRAYCEMTGYSRQELIGSSLSLVNANRHEALKKTVQESVFNQGYWQGEIWSRRKNGDIYHQWLNVNALRDELGAVKHFISVIADITQLKESEARLRHLSQHDLLTDLPNRQLFGSLLDDAIKRCPDHEHVAVLMIDLDRFKYINDTLGHQNGDQMLLQVATRLRRTVENDDILLARTGGDEFAFLISNCHHQGDAEQLALQIINSMEETFHIKGQYLVTTASIGISLYPNHGINSEALIKNADTAVHQAKENGRNNFAVYAAEHSQKIRHWVSLEPALRKALAREQFELLYQPQADALTGYICGAEALLRWNYPPEGQLPPSAFLNILEGTGLIKEVGNWVLDQACAQTAKWHEAGYSDFRVAINIDSQQFLAPGFVEMVTATLEKYQLNASAIELEIIENLIVEHADTACPILDKLHKLGVRLALDDFGTGYSSLSYLKKLPVQKLKIDRTLVKDIPHDPSDEAIVRAVIALGHSLNLSVCAEGVETEAHKIFLRREHCDQLQGYLLSKPATVNAIDILLSKQR